MKRLAIILALWLGAEACMAQHAFGQILLREDTASQVVSIGPFLDPADGTAEGGLTIANTDVRLKVNGGADAAKNSGGCTHGVNGMYDCTFDATDTATVGRLNVSICATGAVCVRQNFLVVEEAVFDNCCVASAAPLTAAGVVNEWETQSQADPTGFHVNVLEIGGTAQTANDNGADINDILVDTSTTLDDFLDTEITALMNARTQLFPGADADSVLTADSGDTNTLVDTELTFSNDVDIDGVYVVRSDGQRCFVDSFSAATDTIEFGACTFTGAWSTQTYKLYPANTQ